MSKSKKAVIVASIFIVVGVIIVFLSFAINGFHFPNGSVDLLGMKALPDYMKKTVQIKDDFNAVDIAGEASTDVVIRNSDTGNSYIEYYDTEGLVNTATVVDGVLTFRCEDKRTHHPTISLGFGSDTKTTIYLAEKEYQAIQVTTASGNIDYRYSYKPSQPAILHSPVSKRTVETSASQISKPIRSRQRLHQVTSLSAIVHLQHCWSFMLQVVISC